MVVQVPVALGEYRSRVEITTDSLRYVTRADRYLAAAGSALSSLLGAQGTIYHLTRVFDGIAGDIYYELTATIEYLSPAGFNVTFGDASNPSIFTTYALPESLIWTSITIDLGRSYDGAFVFVRLGPSSTGAVSRISGVDILYVD